MDPVQQAKAICNHGVSVTALQQQLAELKGKASGLELILRTGMQSSASPCFPELAGNLSICCKVYYMPCSKDSLLKLSCIGSCVAACSPSTPIWRMRSCELTLNTALDCMASINSPDTVDGLRGSVVKLRVV